VFAERYNKREKEYPKLFEIRQSKLAYEQGTTVLGFGYTPPKPETKNVQYEDFEEGFRWTITQVTYARGVVVTEEMLYNNRFQKAIDQTEALGFSITQTREYIGFNILNDGWDTTVTYGDGKELFSTSHPNKKGGTWSNTPNPQAPLSEKALEDAYIAITGFKTDAGLQAAINPDTVWVPPALHAEAVRQMLGTERPGTANREISAINRVKMFPGGIQVGHFLDSTKAWFVTTDLPHGFLHVVNWEDRFAAHEAFDLGAIKSKVTGRWAFGVTDARCCYGSQGE